MRAGRLRSRVVLERQSEVQDAMGQRVQEWTPLAIVRASIEPIRGNEFIAASGERAELTTRIRIRYSSDVADLQPRDRVNYGDNLYDIQSVINTDDRNRELQLMCIHAIVGSSVTVFSFPHDYAQFRDGSTVEFLNTDNAEFI